MSSGGLGYTRDFGCQKVLIRVSYPRDAYRREDLYELDTGGVNRGHIVRDVGN